MRWGGSIGGCRWSWLATGPPSSRQIRDVHHAWSRPRGRGMATLAGAARADALVEAGVPAGVVPVVQGFGDAGAALVESAGVHTIAFTGSSAVGLEIARAAAETRDGQAHVKRVVAEMGGKNAIVVDADADLDEAAPAIVRSAFAYAGQKCSAASLILAHRRVAASLTERLAGALEALTVGQAEDFGTDVPPLIEADAQ